MKKHNIVPNPPQCEFKLTNVTLKLTLGGRIPPCPICKLLLSELNFARMLCFFIHPSPGCVSQQTSELCGVRGDSQLWKSFAAKTTSTLYWRSCSICSENRSLPVPLIVYTEPFSVCGNRCWLWCCSRVKCWRSCARTSAVWGHFGCGLSSCKLYMLDHADVVAVFSNDYKKIVDGQRVKILERRFSARYLIWRYMYSVCMHTQFKLFLSNKRTHVIKCLLDHFLCNLLQTLTL